MIQIIDNCLNGESDEMENEENSVSPASRVVFLGGLFTEVERAVPSPSEKQNDFAVRFQRTFQLSRLFGFQTKT